MTPSCPGVWSSGWFGEIARPTSNESDDFSTVAESWIKLNSDRVIEKPPHLLSVGILVNHRLLGT
jgi:hypothetical protein